MLEFLEHRIAPATFIVTNLDDAGPGSLRDAIDQANDRSGADVILFQKGLTGVIELTTGQIEVTDKLTITGPGASKLAISAGLDSAILSVSDGVNDVDSPLSLSGLELRDGASSGTGGAINSTESLKIRNCVFYNNKSNETGGAIAVSNFDAPGSLNLNGCIVSANLAQEGSGFAHTAGGDGAPTKLLRSKVTGNFGSEEQIAELELTYVGNTPLGAWEEHKKRGLCRESRDAEKCYFVPAG